MNPPDSSIPAGATPCYTTPDLGRLVLDHYPGARALRFTRQPQSSMTWCVVEHPDGRVLEHPVYVIRQHGVGVSYYVGQPLPEPPVPILERTVVRLLILIALVAFVASLSWMAFGRGGVR